MKITAVTDINPEPLVIPKIYFFRHFASCIRIVFGRRKNENMSKKLLQLYTCCLPALSYIGLYIYIFGSLLMQFFGSITTNSIKGNSKILIFYLTVAQNENFVYKVKDQLYLNSLNDDFRSMPVSEKLRVYAFPSPKLTLTCYH